MATNIIRISGLPRTEFGKGAARRLRRDWRIPAVLYGTFHEPIHVSFELLEFQGIVRNHGSNAILEVEIDGEDNLCMIKAVDQNVLTLDIDHADLLSVKRGETVEVDVPVVSEGEAGPGTQVVQDADTVTIEADVLSIPEEITFSIEGKEVGDQVTAGDLKMPGNTSLVSDADTLIVNIIEPEVAPEPEETDDAVTTEADAAEDKGDSEE
ncbi:MAG: 50S ribosomal protein L25/general stress protein Ctc [Corynebacterium sp.]|uniref:50S ribosomal protein L25/general stress protein Ctc n=1 Tax=unclassified Corynebacterium TaxID=2624378 RepID=UPI00264878D1|nr:50S ribosomal protein L25/general stress protein Ctc [Corynebacterium sp.]MDN5581332.1 50S ribosomal protein L25/general stress protein Ctc [Corynebacterium sp.]MDN5719875.1 50S ribosomal protein L25/general stress protein Ctc [Corynebacterium sp.]MDN6258480.1 50S ribosomal protein L25/general stress protein Ctc [Corynebacterium sp.]